MADLNVQNRTLAIMDNLQFLAALNSECVDLIAIDPPFAANETFTGKPKPPITPEEVAEERTLALRHGVDYTEGLGHTRVDDVWTWDDRVHKPWVERIEGQHPEVVSVIDAVQDCASENEAAYVAYMAARLLECHRVLKDTGSIYVHCDWHANSYLRMLLDAIFGASNFRNQIAWCYTGPGNVTRWFPRKYDTILFYCKDANAGPSFNRDAVRVPYQQLNVQHTEPSAGGIGGSLTRENVEEYVERGKVPEDWWTERTPGFGPVGRRPSENAGYSTQKPVALYQRIITASSNPNDVVLDIFAGCATTAVAAESLGRRWIACDMAYRSWTMIKRRFYQNGYALSDMTDSTRRALGEHQTELQQAESHTIGPHDLPARDPDPDDAQVPNLRLRGPRPRHAWQRLRVAEMRTILAEAQALNGNPETEVVCAGCGRVLEVEFMQLDHIQPKKDRGVDFITNRILLCGPCNRRKRAYLTLSGLLEENRKAGWMKDRDAAEHAQVRARDRVEIETNGA